MEWNSGSSWIENKKIARLTKNAYNVSQVAIRYKCFYVLRNDRQDGEKAV